MLKMTSQGNPTPSRFQEQDVALYEQLEAYPWDSDPEFQSGLQAILGQDPSPDQAQHLILCARCFYFSRYITSTDLYRGSYVLMQ